MGGLCASVCRLDATQSASNPKFTRTCELVVAQVQKDQRCAGAQLRRNSTCAGGVQQLNSVCVDLALHKKSRTSELIIAQVEVLKLTQLP